VIAAYPANTADALERGVDMPAVGGTPVPS
jgi:hypothetical protein